MRFHLPYSRTTALLAIGAYAFLAAPVYATDSPSDQYIASRRLYPPRPGLTLATVTEEPDTYRGTTLEVTGRLLGIARSDDGSSLMLATDHDGALLLPMSQMPSWIQPGDRLRALVVLGGSKDAATRIGIPEMQIVAVASASDIEAAEMRWQQESAQHVAREQQATRGMRASARVLSARAAGARGMDVRAITLSRSLSPRARAIYEPYRAAISSSNRRLSEADVDAITTSILLFSERMDVDPRLIIALVIAESDFDPHSTSRKGAMGLAQIMPDEAHDLGLSNPYDPVQNIAGAVYLLKGRLNKYSGGGPLSMQHIILALASYNAGMGAVKKYGGVPPFRETRNYVKKIEKIYRRLCGTGAGV